MAELLTIARPYAEAAFKHAREAQSLPSWSQALARLSEVVSSPAARDIIGNPALSAAQVARLMTDVVGSLDSAQQNFVRLLADNERLSVIAEIAAHFEGLRNQHEGVLQAEIVSAFPIDEAQGGKSRRSKPGCPRLKSDELRPIPLSGRTTLLEQTTCE